MLGIIADVMIPADTLYLRVLENDRLLVHERNSKVDSIETGCIVIAYLLPRSDQENGLYIMPFQLLMIKFCCHCLIC